MMNRRAFVTSLLSPVALGCSAGPAAAPRAPELGGAPSDAAGGDDSLARERERATLAMKRAARFMIEQASYQGGYVWTYLADFSRCWGELEARRTMLWVQPPGTPSVGQLWLDAFHATGDPYYLDAAFQTAGALIAAQHPSGGWSYVHDFAGEAALSEWYSTYGRNAWRMEEFQVQRANATFDDACTSSATQFLLRLELDRSSVEVSAALGKALGFLLDSQYESGGWPQRYPLEADYTRLITFNDDVLGENLKTLIMAYVAHGAAHVLGPLRAGMECVAAMQQPMPQPGWGLQHEQGGTPAAGRTFEPAALVTHTTGANIELLLAFYDLTGDEKYLRRLPEALDWLDAVQLPPESARELGGTHPTFIERGSGDPLYVHRRGSNGVNGRYYVDKIFSPRLSHYNPVRRVDVAQLRRALSERRTARRAPLLPDKAGSLRLPRYFSLGEHTLQTLCTGAPAQAPPVSAELVASVIDELDARGRWLGPLSFLSNRYQGPGSAAPYLDDTYASTNVGDRSDTSPFPPEGRPSTYPPEAPPSGISVARFIRNMAILIAFVSPDTATSERAAEARVGVPARQ
jgi:PelA/Pel-15E family pectate lyase